MFVAMIACLAVTLGYVIKRWGDSRHEIAELQVQVASLKRQLRRQRTHAA
jgi:hypothetical protein